MSTYMCILHLLTQCLRQRCTNLNWSGESTHCFMSFQLQRRLEMQAQRMMETKPPALLATECASLLCQPPIQCFHLCPSLHRFGAMFFMIFFYSFWHFYYQCLLNFKVYLRLHKIKNRISQWKISHSKDRPNAIKIFEVSRNLVTLLYFILYYSWN